MSADAAGVLRAVANYLEAHARFGVLDKHEDNLETWDAELQRCLAACEVVMALDWNHLRALAAQAEAGDGYRIALDDALPVLELCLERGQVLDRMTQPSMGRHPLQDEYERVDYRLRRACKPYKLWPIVQQARAALAAAEEVG